MSRFSILVLAASLVLGTALEKTVVVSWTRSSSTRRPSFPVAPVTVAPVGTVAPRSYLATNPKFAFPVSDGLAA